MRKETLILSGIALGGFIIASSVTFEILSSVVGAAYHDITTPPEKLNTVFY